MSKDARRAGRRYWVLRGFERGFHLAETEDLAGDRDVEVSGVSSGDRGRRRGSLGAEVLDFRSLRLRTLLGCLDDPDGSRDRPYVLEADLPRDVDEDRVVVDARSRSRPSQSGSPVGCGPLYDGRDGQPSLRLPGLLLPWSRRDRRRPDRPPAVCVGRPGPARVSCLRRRCVLTRDLFGDLESLTPARAPVL